MHKIIPRKNLPSNWPIFSSMTTYLMLDKFQAPGWVCGAVWTVVFVGWIASGYCIFSAEEEEIFPANS